VLIQWGIRKLINLEVIWSTAESTDTSEPELNATIAPLFINSRPQTLSALQPNPRHSVLKGRDNCAQACPGAQGESK
jgi:hypothetical protein